VVDHRLQRPSLDPEVAGAAEVQPLLGLAPEGDEDGARDERPLLELEVLALPDVTEHVAHRLAEELWRQAASGRRPGEQPGGELASLGHAVVVGHGDPPSPPAGGPADPTRTVRSARRRRRAQ
jgi:hypothetical protein